MAIRSNVAGGRVVTLATIGCALALTACGSSSEPKSSPSGDYSQGVKYADCMRSHGVSNFPDPFPGGGFDVSGLGAETQSPTFASAQDACVGLRPGGSAPLQVTGAQEVQMTAKARCIRKHGVPNFPDPTFSAGAGKVLSHPLAGVEPASPGFKQAVSRCNGGHGPTLSVGG